MSAFTDVPCPVCKADTDQPCTSPDGRSRVAPHPQREDASRDAWLVSQGYQPLGKGARTS